MTSSITPGPVSRALRSAFDDGSVERGERYFRQGRAQIARGGPMSVRAHVSGSSNYLVDVEIREKGVYADCTCPHYQDHGVPCKHIWAAIREAEARGMLAGDGARLNHRLILEDLSVLEEAAEVEDIEEEAPVETDIAGWEQHLEFFARHSQSTNGPAMAPWPEGRELFYLVSRRETLHRGRIVLDLFMRDLRTAGVPGKLRPLRFLIGQITQIPDEADRRILSMLVGARDNGYGYVSALTEAGQTRYVLPGPVASELIPQLCATGRCLIDAIPPTIAEGVQLRWDDGPEWALWLCVRASDDGQRYEVAAELRQPPDSRLAGRAAMLDGGLLLADTTMARARSGVGRAWMDLLDPAARFSVPVEQAEHFIERLISTPALPELDLPEELRYERVEVVPRPRLAIHRPKPQRGREPRLLATLRFRYDDMEVSPDDDRSALVQSSRRRWIPRALRLENEAQSLLTQLGLRRSWGPVAGSTQFELSPRRLSAAVHALIQEGWLVEADGRHYRPGKLLEMEVRSGIDWFELHGSATFDGGTVALPALLAALRKGESTVVLDDGNLGILPEDWLRRYSGIVRLGTADEDHLRFSIQQVGVLDALLEMRPEVRVDEGFEQMRRAILEFDGIVSSNAPEGFRGELREYQRDGLGWLHFLQQFGFGGCLADDMGLGKTVQVLALVEERRALREASKQDDANGARCVDIPPSLVVVPKSLVFNWREEAQRFAPGLRVLDHTGAERSKESEYLRGFDLIITTYGTLRRDVLLLKDFEFDYIILDEAQAIKNPSTEAAKAARLLRGRHRLALSGTPIENHLGELWSLFEFLNPGLLGSISALGISGVSMRMADEETLRILARVLRPFILRRTKAQVARDLPPKLEQTLHCELSTEERRQYDELREHYRAVLLQEIEENGIARAKIQILEALLRLRQAACHTGLLDKRRTRSGSAKLDLLRERLSEVVDAGAKALVFSQFTSLLDIVRQQLDHDNIPYEYLDGKTRDREERVERFQTDPDCRVFLISLKAGGVGLNLTAAEYVFLLDPWWNPAVEAQAIDRTHRIGQDRPVFAYRLIAADTIEQKVLELQQSKRQLADAIISADGGALRDLTKEDLESLLQG